MDGRLHSLVPQVTAMKTPTASGEQGARVYEDFRRLFAHSPAGVEVDFRELLPDAGATERATHMVHPYPAKLLRHIPAFVLSVPEIFPSGGRVLDPFCGSGTTLVEAMLRGGSAFGADINPLGVLISRVKTTPVDIESAEASLDGVLDRARSRRATGFEAAKRLAYWYPPESLSTLAKLRDSIREIEDQDVRDALGVALSGTARDVSLANPRISVPVRLRPEVYPPGNEVRARLSKRLDRIKTVDVAEAFAVNAARTLTRISALPSLQPGQVVEVQGADARGLGDFDPFSGRADEVDLILTSPPYLGAQKYIRATSLNLLCLGLASDSELGELQRQSIGREHFRKAEFAEPIATGIAEADALISSCRAVNPQRAHLAAKYLVEMGEALVAATARLRAGGAFVLVAGGNQLCGREFDTPQYLRSLCERAGLRLEIQLVDTIRSRGLMTRRNREASPIATESVMVFRK